MNTKQLNIDKSFILDDRILAQLLELAKSAGDAILEIYKRDNIVAQYKPDSSPLTEADIASHVCIMNGLKKISPNIPILSEEGGASSEELRASSLFWLVDPLDGTKEFLSRGGEFTVNIALIEDGVSLFGIVYAPALNTMYWGGPGIGAFRKVNSEHLSIVVNKGLDAVVTKVVASRHHLNSETEALISALGECELVQRGSSLKFCLIAEGAADIYPRLGPTCEWDTAAAQAVLEGAGGVVVDINGKRLKYGKSDTLNPYFIASRSATIIPDPDSYGFKSE